MRSFLLLANSVLDPTLLLILMLSETGEGGKLPVLTIPAG